MTTKEWLEQIQNHCKDIEMLCEQLKSHLEIYGHDSGFLSGSMHLMTAYKDFRKFIVDNSNEPYKSEL